MRKTLIPSIEDRLWEKKAFEKLIRQEKESIKESEKQIVYAQKQLDWVNNQIEKLQKMSLKSKKK
jgi:hypothetical protein